MMQLRENGMFLLVVTAFALGTSPAKTQEVKAENIPQEIAYAVGTGKFAETYSIDGSLNPFYLRGDFEGDGKTDYAFHIKSRISQESGVAIWLSSAHKMVILGAGIPFEMNGSAASDLDWLDTWQVYGKRSVEEGVEAGPPPHLKGEAILVGKLESASGLLYWNGKTFVWYQQGD